MVHTAVAGGLEADFDEEGKATADNPSGCKPMASMGLGRTSPQQPVGYA